MKPITKKYHSKDLNIAYNDGLEEGRFESRQLPEVVRMCKMARQKALKEELEFLEDLTNPNTSRTFKITCPMSFGKVIKRISKLKKELGEK